MDLERSPTCARGMRLTGFLTSHSFPWLRGGGEGLGLRAACRGCGEAAQAAGRGGSRQEGLAGTLLHLALASVAGDRLSRSTAGG
jgi:hypothetical protein